VIFDLFLKNEDDLQTKKRSVVELVIVMGANKSNFAVFCWNAYQRLLGRQLETFPTSSRGE